MYVWRIDRLKSQLREGPLNQRAAFAYIFATLLLYVVTTALPLQWSTRPTTRLDWLAYAGLIAVAGGGIYAAYRANGGSAGADFAARYFALGWVLFLRLALLFFVPAIMLVVAGGAAFGDFDEAKPESTDDALGWTAALVWLVFESVYYWRLAHHLKQVAHSAPTRPAGFHE